MSAAPDPASVARVAGALRGLGAEPGRPVAWQLPTGDDAVLLTLACRHLGAIAAPLHPRAGAAEVEHMVTALDARPVLGPDTVVTRLAATARPVEAHPVRDDDPAFVLFTAGTTGPAKGVVHTTRSLAGKARRLVGVHGLGPDDRLLVAAPIAHVSGLLYAVLVPEAARCRAVLMARWDPDEALALVERERVTFLAGPPTFAAGIMHAEGFRPERVRSLRIVSSGGATVTPAFVEEATERLGAFVKRSYGSTEAPTVATTPAGGDPVRARTTDGVATPGTELRTVDGELQVRGPELFAGYLDDAQTAEVMTPEGWYRTGDLASIDDEGWLTITGRVRDLIIRGGENVPAAEVEAALEAHPAVRQAAAVGEPDPVLGERVAAFVVVDGDFDLERCREWFATRGLARFKTPERLVVVDHLPTLPAGKVDKAALRARLHRT